MKQKTKIFLCIGLAVTIVSLCFVLRSLKKEEMTIEEPALNEHPAYGPIFEEFGERKEFVSIGVEMQAPVLFEESDDSYVFKDEGRRIVLDSSDVLIDTSVFARGEYGLSGELEEMAKDCEVRIETKADQLCLLIYREDESEQLSFFKAFLVPLEDRTVRVMEWMDHKGQFVIDDMIQTLKILEVM